MPQTLLHSPADIVRQALIDLGAVTADGAWPCYATHEPDTPDDVVTVYNTQDGDDDGRSFPDGDADCHWGLQIRVRSAREDEGWAKAHALRKAVLGVHLRDVSVADTGYVIYNFSSVRQVWALGTETPQSDRLIFVINFTAAVRPSS